MRDLNYDLRQLCRHNSLLGGYDLAAPETEVGTSSQQTRMKSGGQGRN